jgi:hypothetical protein
MFLIHESKVARWPHGCRRQCSEVVVPALVGFESHRRGEFFPRKEPPPGHGCVCMSSGADGRVMEGRATLFRHQGEVSRVQEYPGASSQIRERGKAIKKKNVFNTRK